MIPMWKSCMKLLILVLGEKALSVLAGSHSGNFSELPYKIADILKSTVKTDFQNTSGGVFQ